MIPFTMNTRAFWVYRWLMWFWYAKMLRRSDKVCHPDCGLCAVQMRINDHYNACAVCQADERECPTFIAMRVEEDRLTEELFPWWTKDYAVNTSNTASSVPVIVLPPWDLNK